MYGGHRCKYALNMKLLCSIMWLGEVCTDTDDTNDTADTDDAQSMGERLFG